MVLWQHLREISDSVQGAWLVTGEFNCLLHEEERIGSPVSNTDLREFKECVIYCDLADMQVKGCKFTWNNKQQGDQRVYCKLDKTLINPHWINTFPDAHTHFSQKGYLTIV